MISYTVISVVDHGEVARLWCARPEYTLDKTKCLGLSDEEIGCYVMATGEVPAPGDSVCWADDRVYWTPTHRRFSNRMLKMVGRQSAGMEMMTGLKEHVDG